MDKAGQSTVAVATPLAGPGAMGSAGSQFQRTSSAPPSTAQVNPHRRRVSDDALLAHIKAINTQVQGEYGWPRMRKELLAHGARGQRAGSQADGAAWCSSPPQA
jgi:hypothetical protein